MKKKPNIGLTSKARSLAVASKSSLPHLLQTYLDGLDALTDGRGFDRDHQKAAEFVIEAVRYAIIRRDALKNIVNFPTVDLTSPVDLSTQLTNIVEGMKDLAKAALR